MEKDCTRFAAVTVVDSVVFDNHEANHFDLKVLVPLSLHFHSDPQRVVELYLPLL